MRFRLLCVKGFASVRSTLAGVAETDSETAQRLEGFASMRSTLASVAETGSGGPRTLINSLPCVRGGGPRSGGRDLQVCGACLQASPRRVVKKQSLTAFGGAPFTQGSLLTNCASFRFSLFDFLSEQRFGLTDEVYFCKRNFNYRGISNKRLICGIFVVYL